LQNACSLSFPAHAGNPVRRDFSVQSLTSLEYWIADDDWICIRYLAAHRARGFPETLPLLEQRAQGKPGARCTRGLVQSVQKETHTSIQVQRRASGLPCAMVLRLITRSPRRPALLPPSLRKYSAKLDASIGASGPHDFAVRVSHARQSQHLRPPHPTARFVTIANRPSCRVRRAEKCH
jgi:hypothetical protein